MSKEDPIEDDWKIVRPDRSSRRDPDPPKSYVWAGLTIGNNVFDRMCIFDRICIEVPKPISCRERNIRGEYSFWTRKFIVLRGHYLPKEPITVDGLGLFMHPEDETPIASMDFGGPLIITHTQGYQLSFRVSKPGVISRAWILDDPNGETPVLYEDPWDINMDYPYFSPAIDRAITNNLRTAPLEGTTDVVERALRAASEVRYPPHPALTTEEWQEFISNSRPVDVL